MVPESIAIEPQLITIDSGARSIYERFHGWPDTHLTTSVMQQLMTDPGELPPAVMGSLLQQGLLQQEGKQLQVTLPVYEQLPLANWQDLIRSYLRRHQSVITPAAAGLRDQWSTLAHAPAWDEIAHSLLLAYLLWGCGSRLLLRQHNCSVMAVIVGAPHKSPGVWHGFIRSNQNHGVSVLLGAAFSHSLRVHQLLNQPEVGQALRSLAEDRSLLVLHPQANRILQRLAGLVAERADESGLHHLAWPALDGGDLRQVMAHLRLLMAVTRQLQREVIPQAMAVSGGHDSRWQGDLPLAIHSLLVRELADLWTADGVLPPLIVPQLRDLG